MVTRRQFAEQYQRYHHQYQCQSSGAEQHRQPLPPGSGPHFPGRCAPAGFQHAQCAIDAFSESDFIQQLRMLGAITLEVLCAFERQTTGEITFDDLVARDEIAIHDRLRGQRWNRQRGAAWFRGIYLRGLHGHIVPLWSGRAYATAHSSAAAPTASANCVTVPSEGAGTVGAGESVKNPNPDKPERPEGPVGKVTHDARGHAVWQWAAETARNLAMSTSQVLRRLDTRSLSLLDEQGTAKETAPVKTQEPLKLQPSVKEAGFDPYEGRASKPAAKSAAKSAAKPAARSPAPGIKPARSSWWQRMLR